MSDLNTVVKNPSELLETFSQDYAPAGFAGMYTMLRNRPPFNRLIVRDMIGDPRILYGLWLIKGPIISNTRFIVDDGSAQATEGKFTFGVKCDRPDVADYIVNNLKRFWLTSAIRALKNLEWGFSGSECLYRVRQGFIHFDELKDLDANDVAPVRYRGELVGMHLHNVRNTKATYNAKPIYLGGPKKLWHVHWRDRNPWWGVSRLYGAFTPWWEAWCDGGFRDVRRLWYHKNAFEGGTMYTPTGMAKLDDGTMIPNKVLGQDLVEKKRSGGALILPNTPSGDGGSRAWEYLPPVSNPTPEGLREYGEDLRTEILEALGIPPEVIESSGNQGFGSSTGRQVPQDAWFAILLELVQWLIYDFRKQVLDFLIAINFIDGENIEYDIEPIDPVPMAGGGMQSGDYHGNQFQEDDGDAKSQATVDQEEVARQKVSSKDYEAARSNKLKERTKGKLPFQMSVSTETEKGQWITIGGRPANGMKHKGGFPVKIDSEGHIIAGGPRSLHGKHVQDAGEHLSSRKKFEPRDRGNNKSTLGTHLGLPHPDSNIGQLLAREIGGDLEEQAGFYKVLKEIHEEYSSQVQKRKKLVDEGGLDQKRYQGADLSKAQTFAEEHGFEFTPQIKALLEKNRDKIKDNRDLKRVFQFAAHNKERESFRRSKESMLTDDGYVAKILDKREGRNQPRTWSTVSANIADELGIPKQEVETAANNVESIWRERIVLREKMKADLRRRTGLTAKKINQMEDGGKDWDSTTLDGLTDAPTDWPEFFAEDRPVGEQVWNFIKEGKQSVPPKSSDEFVALVLDELGYGDNLNDLEITDPHFVDEAHRRIDQEVMSFFEELAPDSGGF